MSRTVDTTDAADKTSTRPWGVLASLAWGTLAFEGMGRLVNLLAEVPSVAALSRDNRIANALFLNAVWSAELSVIVVAIWLRRWPLADYLAWTKPSVKWVILGLLVVLAWNSVQNGLAYALTGQAFDVAGYRAAVAHGTSPWWYVLQWWPAFICAPIVEESATRGFIWRGVEDRWGSRAACLTTSLFFAALHYRYFFANGQLYPGTLLIYIVSGLIFGWLRWKSRSTSVTMIVHAVDNFWIFFSPVIAAWFAA